MFLVRNLWRIWAMAIPLVTLFGSGLAQEQRVVTGKIAFVVNVEGNWDLFIVNGDGSHLARLTETSVDERAPCISPDGGKIVYSTSDGALWMITISTKEKLKLPLPEGRYNHPRWSPDGNHIIYTSYTFTQESDDSNLWIYDLQENKAKEFLRQPGLQDYAAYSPTGDALAYSSSATAMLSAFGATGIQQLWIASLKDGKVRQLLLSNSRDTEPAWSPDGKWIAFSSDRSGNPDLWMITPIGKSLTQLTKSPASESYPTWSPSGREIAYVVRQSEGSEIVIIDVKSRKVRRLAPFGSTRVDLRDPHWR